MLSKKHRRHIRAIIAHVSSVVGRSTLCVAFDLLVKCFAAGALYYEYASLRLYKRTLGETRAFCGSVRAFKYLPFLKSKEAEHIFNEKPLFHKVFNKFIKRDYIHLTHDTSIEYVEKFIASHPVFIAKEPASRGGKSVWLVDSREYSGTQEIVDVLLEKQTSVIEERVINHTALARFSSSSLNTMRMLTLRLPDGVKLIGAFLRFNTLGGIADNQDGYICSIDLETGHFVDIMFVKDYSFKVVGQTLGGITITGTRVPFWEETLDMIKKATTHLDGVYFVPWDVAVTANGPLIIEGNNVPDMTFQDVNNRPCDLDMRRAVNFAKSNRKSPP